MSGLVDIRGVSVSGSRNNPCKGPEVGVCWYLRKHRVSDLCVLGVERGQAEQGALSATYKNLRLQVFETGSLI